MAKKAKERREEEKLRRERKIEEKAKEQARKAEEKAKREAEKLSKKEAREEIQKGKEENKKAKTSDKNSDKKKEHNEMSEKAKEYLKKRDEERARKAQTYRVEKRKIKKSSPHYDKVIDLINLNTEVYNLGIQMAMDAYQNEKTTNSKGLEVPMVLSHFTLTNRFRDNGYRNIYKGRLPAQSIGMAMKGVADAYKSYVAALNKIKRAPEGFRGKVRLPKSKEEGEYFPLKITSQQVRAKGNEVHFPAILDGLVITRKFTGKIREVQFHKRLNKIVVEIAYESDREITPLSEEIKKVAGVDIGINNIFAVAGDFEPFLIDGKKLKSKNKYFCDEYFKLKSEQALQQAKTEERTGQKMSRKEKNKNTLEMEQILARRENVISDYFHKATRTLINELKERDIDTIVLGWTKKEKTEGTGTKALIPIPLYRLPRILEYKCMEAGIRLLVEEESFTSGTSFIDGEDPTEFNYNVERRVYRGLFRSNDGTEINADVNAALQVIKKSKEIPKDVMDNLKEIPSKRVDLLLSPKKIRVGW